MGNLAITGGKPIRNTFYHPKRFYDGWEMKKEMEKLIDSEFLSGYRGSFGPGFWGGPKVRQVEKQMERYLDNKSKKKNKHYVLAVNSATSGLIVACGAVGIGFADKVIVTPYSMTCSATAPMIYGADPIFADVEHDYFCLDAEYVRKIIKERGDIDAVIAVDLFGNPISQELIDLCKEHEIALIEDAAQAPGAMLNGEPTGALGDIGVYSFTQGKHLTCGEGGFIVTKDKELYMKCALIRNHAEAVINSMPEDLQKKYAAMPNMIGFNMRMTEMQAVVLKHQLYHLDEEVKFRRNVVAEWKSRLKVPGIKFAPERSKSVHSYYVCAFLYDEEKVGVPRDLFINAVRAELQPDKMDIKINLSRGVPLWNGYIKPIYRMPLFTKDRENDSPLVSEYMNYPVVEKLQAEELFITLYNGFDDINVAFDFPAAFNKVYEYRKELEIFTKEMESVRY
jgi:dTDP-4-amino-4,6-dideoxygalactose transaminase